MSTDQGKRLQNTIDALMVSYREHPEIEHIGNIDLPAKENIINLNLDVVDSPVFECIYDK